MFHRFRLVHDSEPKYELHLSGRSIFENGDDIVSILDHHGVAQRMREAGPTPVRVGKYSGEIVIQ